jgi:hypothetical protein
MRIAVLIFSSWLVICSYFVYESQCGCTIYSNSPQLAGEFPCPELYLGASLYNSNYTLVRAQPHNLCSAIDPQLDVAGHVLLADSEECSPLAKAVHAQAAGAAGVLLWDSWIVSGIIAYSEYEFHSENIQIPIVACSIHDFPISNVHDYFDNSAASGSPLIVHLLNDRNEWDIWYRPINYLVTSIPFGLFGLINVALGLWRYYRLIKAKGFEFSLSQICLPLLVISSATRGLLAIPPRYEQRVVFTIFFSFPTALLVVSTVLLIFFFRDLTLVKQAAQPSKFLRTRSSRIGFVVFFCAFLTQDLVLSIGRGLYFLHADSVLIFQGVLYSVTQLLVSLGIIYWSYKLENLRKLAFSKHTRYMSSAVSNIRREEGHNNREKTTNFLTKSVSVKKPAQLASTREEELLPNQLNPEEDHCAEANKAESHENQEKIKEISLSSRSEEQLLVISPPASSRLDNLQANNQLNSLQVPQQASQTRPLTVKVAQHRHNPQNSRSTTTIAMFLQSLFTIGGVIVLILGVASAELSQRPIPLLILTSFAHALLMFATTCQIVAFSAPSSAQNNEKKRQNHNKTRPSPHQSELPTANSWAQEQQRNKASATYRQSLRKNNQVSPAQKQQQQSQAALNSS